MHQLFVYGLLISGFNHLRNITEIQLFDGSITKAWTYWYNCAIDAKAPVIISGDILEYLLLKNERTPSNANSSW